MILHGLFGFSDNWQTIAKNLSVRHLVITPDLRNHGRSPHVPSHTYNDMAEDLNAFMDARWMFSAALVGHSMGGKAAMQLALSHPDKVERLAVIDMAPGQSASNHGAIFEAMFGLKPHTVNDRKAAEAFLSERIPQPGVVQFLLKNLTRDDEGYFQWKMNLPVLYEYYQEVLAPVKGPVFDKPALFVRGSNSDYVRDEEWPDIVRQFPQAQLVTINGAGHWVHADRPAELTAVLEEFLR